MRILILEDNADRQVEMSLALRDRFPQYPVEFFSSASAMLSRIGETGLEDVAALVLDHDLEMLAGENGRMMDPGSGLDVARFLEGVSPGPPIVIHTTNRLAGDSMERLLLDSGWNVSRVVPYGNLDWIRETWARTVRNAIVGTIPTPRAETVPARP